MNRLVLAACLLMLAPVTWAQSSDQASQALSYRDFLQSLTPAERKLPMNLVAANRRANGGALPASLNARAASRSAAAGESAIKYRIDGPSSAAVVSALAELAVMPEFVSASRAYVTAVLSDANAIALSQSANVFRITPVRGPTAQGQGATQAAAAHRLADLYPIDKPDASDPALDGSGVVVGLISLPFKQADLDALELETTRIIPASAKLTVMTGDDVVLHDNGEGVPATELDAVDETDGTLDALYLLQLIYDMAPGAHVVMASPGEGSTPGYLATVIDALVAGDSEAGIPAADIVIDDLFYADQSPFEIDEAGEAIASATNAGALYVTSAGDNGQEAGASSTSAVYLSDFDGVVAPAELVAIDPFLDGFYVQSFGGDGLIEVAAALDDLCVFWNEQPNPGATPTYLVWVYDDSAVEGTYEVSSIGVPAPGGCLGAGLPAGAKIAFDQGAAPVSGSRLMVTGVRSLVPATLAYSSALFDEVTAGSIRGHAATPDALTVAASDLCITDPFADYAGCAELSISGFSSDGEASGTDRFFWESDGVGGYTAITGGLAVSKPDLAAAGKSLLTRASAGATTPNDFYGTSASAAVTAGIAALYWQYVEDELTVSADFVAETVRGLLLSATLDVGDAGADILSGAGVIDAPKPFDDGSGDPIVTPPYVDVALTAKSAGASLVLTASALGGTAGDTYAASCTDGSGTTWATLSNINLGTSYPIQATPGAAVTCTVTGSVPDGSGGTVTSSNSASVTASAVTATTVSFSSDIDSVVVTWATDAGIADTDMLAVSLTCTNTTTGETVVDAVAMDTSPYRVESEDGEPLECTASTTLSVNGGTPSAVGSAVTATTTPDEASSGLPIWLLYQATQP